MTTKRATSSKEKLRQKGHFSGHETFPLRQMWLTKAYRYAAAHNFDPACFSHDSAIAELGVGKNMVSSIRHWALATDVLVEDSGVLRPGRLGQLLIGTVDAPGIDPWFEDTNSVWLVHWALAGRGRRSTTWRWLFSKVSESTFDRDRLVSQLSQWVADEGMSSSANTLRRDLETCLRCYLPRSSAASGEEAAEPLLSELGLIGSSGAPGSFRFNKGPKRTLGVFSFYFSVLDFWDLKHAALGVQTPSTIPLLNIGLDFYSPGRVFKLSEEEIETRLQQAETLIDGGLIYDESVKNVSINHQKLTPKGSQTDRESNKYELARQDFSSIKAVV